MPDKILIEGLAIFTSDLFAPIVGNAEKTQPENCREKSGEHIVEKYLKQSKKLVNKKLAFVGSVNENNAPNVKAMLVAKHDGLKTFYFASNNSAMRTEQYKKNNKACIYFNGGPVYKGLMLEGIMEICNDEEHKKMIWQIGMGNVYKNGGIKDPDYCVLKFTALSGRHYYMLNTHTFIIDDNK